MTSRSPSPDSYDDEEFDSPTASEAGGIRPPSIPVTPSPVSNFNAETSKSRHTPAHPAFNGHALDASHDDYSQTLAINGFQQRSLSREQTFITRNDSTLSRRTYTAPDADYDDYDDDFDNDDDLHSERSYTPNGELSDVSRETYTEIPRHSPELDSFNESDSATRKLVDVTNMSQPGSTTSVRRATNESRPITKHNDISRQLGSRTHTNLSVTKSVKRLPYSNRKSVRSIRNGASRMSTTTRQFDVNDLRHEMRVIGDEIETLKMENKVLKRNNILLTHQLDKREKEEVEIPTLYDRQVKELRVLKDQLRRQQERYDKVHYRLRRTEKNLATSQREENALEKKAEDCELKERSRLRKQLEKVEQENDICDEKIRQMEKYVENLEKCHEAEVAAEIEKQKETQADIDRLCDQMQSAKQSMQAKESELEKFKIQRVSRLATSRTLMNTAMSGHLTSISESPKPPTHQRTDAHVGHLKALPAPPVKGRQEATPVKGHEMTPATDNDINKQITPSPPTTSRPNRHNSRTAKIKVSPEKPINKSPDRRVPPKSVTNNKQGPKTSLSTTASSQPPASSNNKGEEIKKVIDEEKKAELIRTNMALSQTMKVQKPSAYIPPTVPSEAPQLVREDSWAAVNAAQANISAAGKGNIQFGSAVSVNKSARELTFAIGKSPSTEGVRGGEEKESKASQPEAARKKQQAESDEKTEALLRDMREGNGWQKSMFGDPAAAGGTMRSSPNDPQKVDRIASSLFPNNDTDSTFELTGYQPSTQPPSSHKPEHENLFSHSVNDSHPTDQSSKGSNIFGDKSGKFLEAETSAQTNAPRRRETTIINRRTPATDIFGSSFNDLQFS